jgi:ribosomal protein S12 methylthiotransferase accessory factor YcaO
MSWDSRASDSSTWDSSPTPPPLPYFQIKPQTPRKTMKRQDYFPSRIAEQVNWLDNFGNKITIHGVTVGLDAPTIAAAANDAHWGHYVMGTWLTAVRAIPKGTTEAVDFRGWM